MFKAASGDFKACIKLIEMCNLIEKQKISFLEKLVEEI
jgi:hypothetical protein